MNNFQLILCFLFFFSQTINQGVAQIQNDEVYEYPGLNSQDYRYNIRIPDINGYKTLKCDFHVHTVFSDGKVWPDQRVKEAWNEGLDVIAITDHLEYRSNKEILISDHNKSFEIAKKQGDAIGMLVVKGAEITRQKPLGHLNALFIKDANKLDVPDGNDAINEAVLQGAYVLWNHPGWPDDVSTIYPVHRKLITENKIHGVEVFNGWEAYPKVIDWCNEFGLAPFSNSDIHYTSSNLYREKAMRPMTLVFAKEYTEESLKEALFSGRTVAFYNHVLSGKEEFLKAIIKASLSTRVINQEKGTVEITNHSDIVFEIQYGKYMYPLSLYPNQVLRANIPAGSEVTFKNCITGKDRYVVSVLW
jgi:hypothetical protein